MQARGPRGRKACTSDGSRARALSPMECHCETNGETSFSRFPERSFRSRVRPSASKRKGMSSTLMGLPIWFTSMKKTHHFRRD